MKCIDLQSVLQSCLRMHACSLQTLSDSSEVLANGFCERCLEQTCLKGGSISSAAALFEARWYSSSNRIISVACQLLETV